MRTGILTGLAALVAGLLAAAAPAAAQDPDWPIPRMYPTTGFDRASAESATASPAREAATALEAACTAGDMVSCADLGLAFETGAGRPQNRPVAELIYREACEANVAIACHRLGMLLRFADDRAQWMITAPLFVRACRMGLAEACDVEADDLAAGFATGTSDPEAALALRRRTCAGGSAPSCTTLALVLIRESPDEAGAAEGLALLDRQCRAGRAEDCNAAMRHFERQEEGYGRRTREYESLACTGGDSWACMRRGKHALDNGIGPEARAAATAFYERACALNDYHCTAAAAVRDEPQLNLACEAGERAACVALGRLHADWNGPFKDHPRAIALLGGACQSATDPAEAQDLCGTAGTLALELVQAGETEGLPDAARIEGLLMAACLSGEDRACLALADALIAGRVLASNPPYATDLYRGLCDRGDTRGCDGLSKAIRVNAAAPLVLASSDWEPPEYSPDELAEMARIAEAERLAREARDLAAACTNTEIEWRGITYADSICVQVTAIINGFAVPRGNAPWQALLWRPEVLGTQRLAVADRVLCGGAVIRTGWVLTAAHCLTDLHGIAIRTGGHRIRLGVSNPLVDEGFSYPILRVIPHPGFKTSTLVYDIALVQYDPAAGRREGGPVGPIAAIRLDPKPLAQRPIRARMPAYTFGWGRLAAVRGATPGELRGARLELQDPQACTDLTAFRDTRRDAVLCAAGPQGQQACFGDSGGPLITYADEGRIPTVIAVVSNGVDCGTTGVPSRFTRIAHPEVQKWLNQNLPPPPPASPRAPARR
jgi:TPR repeat protein